MADYNSKADLAMYWLNLLNRQVLNDYLELLKIYRHDGVEFKLGEHFHDILRAINLFFTSFSSNPQKYAEFAPELFKSLNEQRYILVKKALDAKEKAVAQSLEKIVLQ